jgi:hypothetical protein
MTPDTSSLVWKIANDICALGLGKYQPNQNRNLKQKLVLNLIDIGEKKLVSLSLAMFNKKLACMMAGNLDDIAGMTEEDELPSMQMSIELEEGNYMHE